MFEPVDDIYNHIGQAMFDALPDEWSEAWVEVLIHQPKISISFVQQYLEEGATSPLDFNVDEVNGRYIDSDVDKAFYALYELMKSANGSWNKARFQITSDGDFDIQFKYDEDFVWLKSLDIDGKEFDDLDIDVINQIESWSGLSDDAPRYWKQ